MISWHQRPMLGVDFETTGVDVEQDRIVSAAAVYYGGGRPTAARTWLSDLDGAEIPAAATAIHKITTEQAHRYGLPARDVVTQVVEAAAEAANRGLAIVVMNASFDLTLLDREAHRYGVHDLFSRSVPRVLDPRVLDKRVQQFRPGRRRLEDLCNHYVVPIDGAHRAEVDARAACAVTWKIIKRHPWLTRYTLGDLHEEQARWAKEQAEGLRTYFERTPGKEREASAVRTEWPFIPRPWTPGTPS